MSRRVAAFAVALIVLVTPTCFGQVPWSKGSSVLVLRSGQVFRGQVTPMGQRYLVALGPGNEVRIAASDVAFHCGSILEAFQRKRAELPPGNVNARLDLVEWCLRQELVPQAAEQLTIALRLEPEHPRVAALERRLTSAARAPTGPAPTDKPVVPVSLDDLERANRDLPTGSVERFTSSIQPLLLNRCGTNSCHGPSSSSSYHLLRPGQGNTASRRFTLRNLHATLAYVDRETPENSPLLSLVRDPHGPNQLKVFSASEQGQYEQLAHWVRQVSQPKSIPAPATITGHEKHPPHATRLTQTAHTVEANATSGGSESSSHSTDSGRKRPGDPAGEPASPALPSASAGAAPDAHQPVDPFDPEVFNRRYFRGSTTVPLRPSRPAEGPE